MKKQWKIIAMIAFTFLVFSFLNNDLTMFSSLTTVYVILLPLTSISYDEHAKWDRFARALPLSVKEIVLSKYVTALSIALLQAIISMGLSVALAGRMGLEVKDLIANAMGSSGAALFMLAIILPLLYKFGVEKARLVLVIVFVLPALIMMLIAQSGINIPLDFLDQASYLLPVVLGVILLMLLIGSVWLSMRIYQRKEF